METISAVVSCSNGAINGELSHHDGLTEDPDLTTMINKVCHGCKKPIEDQYRLRVSPDMEWHVSCLICKECRMFLDETCTCFIKDGHAYCRKDYLRLFGIKCSKCLEQILPLDMVMRISNNQIYHLGCFCCSVCERQLSPGEQFGMEAGKLFCKTDFDSLSAMGSPSDSSSGNEGGNSCQTNGGASGPNSTGSGGGGGGSKRSTEKGPRVRTVLTEQQLQTLRRVYSTNPRPDALLKEHLVEITGLSSRVIRVWFQNKRCKDKKRMQQQEASRMHQLQQQQGGPKILPPLTPQTPITPDGIHPGQISPHHSFPYPPPPPPPHSAYDILPSSTAANQISVSPVSSYHHQVAWGSPTDTISPFEQDYSPLTTEHQPSSFIYTSAVNTQAQPSHFAF